jgi:hypothetical protein
MHIAHRTMLLREISMLVKNHMKHQRFGKNAELLNVDEGGTCSNHGALRAREL